MLTPKRGRIERALTFPGDQLGRHDENADTTDSETESRGQRKIKRSCGRGLNREEEGWDGGEKGVRSRI